ncbi:hypothetical protein SAMN05660226_02337 [Parapedobacter luteus]|uniref:Methylamine utilisation protein MauE domain-containing protein n=1 Tax=Parapedobacter luteus TaxID=623280 RepID=A0A1T5CU21_9SPHI|nr:MauE/DoxX family redox-associated membrane protein [Parapedobacter luteus]SKB62833.1 hypothetical protein SAMN05660226_02337 [Parapedobacter luteus]
MNTKTLYPDIAIRVLFVALYTYTAAMKLLDFPVYRIKMRRQHFFEPLKEWLVWGVPLAELLVATGLILPFLVAAPRLGRAGLVGNLMLISAFTLYTGLAASGIFGYVPCSCGGFLEGMGWWVHFLFNLVFTALAAVGVWLQRDMIRGADVSPSVCGRFSG